MVPYRGRLGTSVGFILLPARETLKEWAKINNCGRNRNADDRAANTPDGLETRVETYTDCTRRRDRGSLFHREGRPHLARRRTILFPCASSEKRTKTLTPANSSGNFLPRIPCPRNTKSCHRQPEHRAQLLTRNWVIKESMKNERSTQRFLSACWRYYLCARSVCTLNRRKLLRRPLPSAPLPPLNKIQPETVTVEDVEPNFPCASSSRIRPEK